MDDGSRLLTGPDVGPLLRVAVDHAGGRLLSWRLHNVDAFPGRSTTATYMARIGWAWGERDELLGVSARAGELSEADANASIFADGNREVAVWIYPADPDLPGLPRATVPDRVADLINGAGLLGRPVLAADLTVTMIGYRPRRRAVIRVTTGNPAETLYIKALRPKVFEDIHERHLLLRRAGVPAPEVALATLDNLLVLRGLPGTPLATALFAPDEPCTAEQLIDLLDSMPPAVASLARRPPWSDAVQHYARMVAAVAPPEVGAEVTRVAEQVVAGLAPLQEGEEPTHGDFHEGQLHVAGGAIVGLLDVDTIGPGRRADDLACLIAHMSTIQRMAPGQETRVRELLARWVPVFDERVDPIELRLRAAAVVVSLATGPYRGQEPDWEATTRRMVRTAVGLVRQVAEG